MMVFCCRRPGRDRNTGLPIRWCCFSGASQRQPSCRSCRPSSTSPISASTPWEVACRTAQALATSQSGSRAPTVSPPFALASAVSSLVAQAWAMTQAGRTSARVAQAWTTSQAGCTSPRVAISLASSSRVRCWLGGMCEVSSPPVRGRGVWLCNLIFSCLALVCSDSRCCRLLRVCQCSRFCPHLLSGFAAVPGGVQIRGSEHDKKGGTLF